MPTSFYIFLIASIIALIPAYFDHWETWELVKSAKEKRCRHLLKLSALWIIPFLTIIGTIYLGFESIDSAAQERQQKEEYESTTNQLYSATNDLAVAHKQILGLASNVRELKSESAVLKHAIPPRTISEGQRETLIDVLINPLNVAPKIPIKIFIGATNQETKNFAQRLRKILTESGYAKDTNIVEIPEPQIRANAGDNDQAYPELFAIFYSADGTIPNTTLPGNFGSIGMFIPEPIVIANGDSKRDNAPRVYRNTTNPNDIVYGIMGVLNYVGVRCSPLAAFTNLQPGQVGFFIPEQGD